MRKKEGKKKKVCVPFRVQAIDKNAPGYKIQDNFINPFRKLHGLP